VAGRAAAARARPAPHRHARAGPSAIIAFSAGNRITAKPSLSQTAARRPPSGAWPPVHQRAGFVRRGNARSIRRRHVIVGHRSRQKSVGRGRDRRAHAVTAIIDDVLGPVIVGRDPRDVVVI
jgi:hypothetical protein